MIDMHEMRLGNFLIHETEGLINIGHIQDNFYGALLNGCSPEYFSPIPLTEEWLRKLGFQQSGCYWFYGDVYIYEKGIHNVVYYYKVNYGEREIKYVHQLQSLYFALTGEELTLKESI